MKDHDRFVGLLPEAKDDPEALQVGWSAIITPQAIMLAAIKTSLMEKVGQ